MKKLIFVLFVIVLGIGGYSFVNKRKPAQSGPVYRTMAVEKGRLVSLVNASGTLRPVITVIVGSQVSGRIAEIAADYNDQVRAGQVIARIAPETFEAREQQSLADLAVAGANVQTKLAMVELAKADLKNSEMEIATFRAQVQEARVTLKEAGREQKRKNVLLSRKVVSAAAVDAARADFEQKQARLVAALTRVAAKASILLAREASIRIAEAEVVTARAQVKHRQAALNQVRVDLANTYIRSPVDGVVINRRVDVGQTVAASLQAPELFTIAKDLSAMQVEVDVDEADIGRIQAGLKAKFKVDAFPEREFQAEVSQVRLQPTVVQNVVTYTVLLAVNNAQGLLLPGMTANVDIVAQERDDILKVSNAALRFRPPNAKDGTAARPEARRGGAGRSERIIESLSEQLKLDPSQQKQLRDIFADAREKFVGLRMSGASPDEMREAFQNLRREVREAIPSVMNSDQLEAYKKIVARRSANPVRRGRVWILDEAKKAKRVDIWLGTSDDNFTEVVRGELKENDQVITGIERTDDDKKGGLFGLKF